jgi:hypothetical protein
MSNPIVAKGLLDSAERAVIEGVVRGTEAATASMMIVVNSLPIPEADKEHFRLVANAHAQFIQLFWRHMAMVVSDPTNASQHLAEAAEVAKRISRTYARMIKVASGFPGLAVREAVLNALDPSAVANRLDPGFSLTKKLFIAGAVVGAGYLFVTYGLPALAARRQSPQMGLVVAKRLR